MPRVFHQNMRVFGGGVVDRNAVFTGAFARIQVSASSSFAVAGFTEIVNDRTAFDAVGRMADTLFDSRCDHVVVEVGNTAGDRTEYVTIAWNRAFLQVSRVGLYSRQGDGTWRPTLVDLPPDRRFVPGGVGGVLDSRGVAFVLASGRGSLANRRFALGFFHNMYNLGDRSGAVQNLPRVMRDLSVDEDAEVIVGGDFNVIPPPVAGEPPPLQSRFEDIRVLAAIDEHGQYVNTTSVHPYDYWFVNRPWTYDEAHVHPETRIDGASDHAGISLDL